MLFIFCYSTAATVRFDSCAFDDRVPVFSSVPRACSLTRTRDARVVGPTATAPGWPVAPSSRCVLQLRTALARNNDVKIEFQQG